MRGVRGRVAAAVAVLTAAAGCMGGSAPHVSTPACPQVKRAVPPLAIRLERPPAAGRLCPLLRDSAVVASPLWGATAEELRSLDPQLVLWQARSLLYACDGCGLTGFDLRWVLAHHPEWIMRAADGDEVHPADHPSWVLLDFADQTYQAAWSQHVRLGLGADGYTGVAIDDAGNAPTWTADPIDPRTGIGLTASDRATYLAQALSLVRADMRTHGFLVLAENGPPGIVEPAQINSADAVSAGGGFARLRGGRWSRLLHYYLQAQRDRVGTYVWENHPAAQRARRLYGLAGYLLVATPTGAYGGPDVGGVDLGPPPDTPPIRSGDAWLRAYPRGVVAVNPSPGDVTVSMGAAGKVTLPSGTAAVAVGSRLLTSF